MNGTNSLTNKVALITGGSRGIGAAIVRRLAADGASVVFTYSASSEKALALMSEIETDLNEDDAIRDIFCPMTSIGRMGKDSEVASLVAYLASSKSSFITGSALTIDGGYLA